LNKLLPWVKAHWIIVVSVAVMLIAPPTMIYFANQIADSKVAEVQKLVSADMTELAGSSKVTYSIAAPTVGGAPFEVTSAPNEVYIEEFARRRAAQTEQLSKIGAVAVAFNKGNRAPILAGVFPDSESQKIRRIEFQDEFMKRAFPALLKRLKIGTTQDPTEANAILVQKKQEFIAKKTGQTIVPADMPVPEAIMAEYSEEMRKQRMSLMRRDAASKSMYMTDPELVFRLPPESSEAPDMRTMWDEQWQYWIIEDVLNACLLASSDVADQGIPGAVVKRIDNLVVDQMRMLNFGGEGAPPVADAKAAIALDPKVSVSGRVAGPGTGNGFYDIRTVRLSAVVSLNNLPRLVEALAATNFMTVLDLDLEAVQTFSDLKAGYFYGEEPVVRANLQIETVWIREWMKPLMPKVIREELGVVEDAPVDPAAAPAGGTTPPPNG